MKYGIIGSGSANPKIVHDGLADIRQSDPEAEFVIHARRAPQGAVGDVYDYLFDNECTVHAVHRIDDNPPKALINLCATVETTDDPLKAVIGASDEILLLWDEDNEDSSNKYATMADSAGLPIKDLTMALAPVVVEKPAQESAVEKEETEEPVEPYAFTREELLNMTIGILRRQARAMGLEMGRATKEEIIDAILGDAPKQEPVMAKGDLSGILVYSDDGVLKTLPLDDEVVAQLLGRC